LISHEFTDATVITIAHRLNTIINSDKVLVLSFGEVKEYDSPQNLMEDPNSDFSELLEELKKEENNK
jgi:ABC-type multidrug transport system fused ATPase/permease subunit